MNPNLKYAIQNIFLAMGVWLSKDNGLSTSTLPVMLRSIFKKNDIRCVIDVGANRGQYRDLLRSLIGYKDLIISFEPVSKNVEFLNQKAKTDPLWIICPYALGSKNCEMEINVMKSSEFSSFRDPRHDQVQFRSNTVVDRELVTIKKLDDALEFIDGYDKLMPIFLKLDTQGYDLEVVEGATQSLSSVVALQSEISVMQIYEGMPDYFHSIRELTAAGFDLSGLAPVTVVNDRVVEFDCLMIRR